MAQKKKSTTGSGSKNNQKKSVTYKGKKVDFSQPSKLKPTEAITAKGQKATGISGKNPNITAVRAGINKQKRDQRTLNALEKTARIVTEGALMAGTGGAAGAIGKRATVSIAKKLGMKAFEKTGGMAYSAGMRNLAGATGAGGKVSRTMTPFGPTLRSTRIGTGAQQSARMGNLAKGVENTATRAGKMAQTDKIISSVKTGRKLTQAGSVLGTVGAGVAGRKAGSRGGKGTSKKK